MKRIVLFLFIAINWQAVNALDFSLVGFGGGTTGGKGGETVKVNGSGFKSKCGGSDKRVIMLSGKVGGGASIGSNKTIIGVDGRGEISGGTVTMGNNVILRNLKIHSGRKGKDLVGIYGSKNIWIDHCEIYNYYGDLNGDGKIDTRGDIGGGDVDMYDGIIDITGSSGDITISWSIIHDGFKAMLKSASGNITYHHNRFYNSWERVPSFNGGKGHLFNNYFHDIAQSAINIRKGAVARVEGNVFEKVGNGTLDERTNVERGPIGTYYSANGCWDVSDNIYIESKGNQPDTSTCTYKPPYEYAGFLQPASQVKNTVMKWAGAGKDLSAKIKIKVKVRNPKSNSVFPFHPEKYGLYDLAGQRIHATHSSENTGIYLKHGIPVFELFLDERK